jgi:alpha-galactosidase
MAQIHLDELDLSPAIQGWESPKPRRCVTGGPLRVAGQTYERGVGTHSVGYLALALDGRTIRLQAAVGVDDAVGERGLGAVHFIIRGDGRVLFDSGVRRGGEAAVAVDIDLTGVRLLELLADAPRDITHHGHADWCTVLFTYAGATPTTVVTPRGPTPVPLPQPAAPRFVAGHVWGVRPGRPIIWRIPVIGAEPLGLAAEGLPPGVVLDAETRCLRGYAPAVGSYDIRLTARNAHGSAERVLRLSVGARHCLTPPMGWNSWNAYGPSITQDIVEAEAAALVSHGLDAYGYRYANIDDGWQGVRHGDSAIPWAMQSNERFPDLAGYAARRHAAGQLAGIYSVPSLHSPQGLMGGSGEHPDGSSSRPFVHGDHEPTGAYRFFSEDIAQFAAWGFDYLKLDCQPSPAEVAAYAAAIRRSGRDIVFSLSAGMPRTRIEAYVNHANAWRTTGDLIDTWFAVRNKLKAQTLWAGIGGPGNWNDPDMLVIGETGPGWNAAPGPTRLTWAEQRLHVGLWAFFAAPLLIGARLGRLDEGTKALLTSPGIIELDQDPLGAPAQLIGYDRERGLLRLRRPLSGGRVAVALVNLADSPQSAALNANDTGLDGDWRLSDPWDEQELHHGAPAWQEELPAHGHRLLVLSPA